MAQVLVPGVAQAVETGTVSGHPFALVWHFKKDVAGVNWNGGDLDTLSQTIHNNIGSLIAPLTATSVIFEGNTSVDIGSPTPAEGASTTGVHPGAAAGADPPPSTCILVSFQTLTRYRGGHPRTYMPPASASELTTTEDQWVAAFVGTYNTAFSNLMDNVLASGIQAFHCAVQYTYTYTDDPVHHKYTKVRSGLKATPQVVNWITKAPIATQRRRLGGL